MSFLRYSALNNGVNELEVRRFFSYLLHSTPPLGGIPVGILPYRLVSKKMVKKLRTC